jgi:hypothetical protein
MWTQGTAMSQTKTLTRIAADTDGGSTFQDDEISPRYATGPHRACHPWWKPGFECSESRTNALTRFNPLKGRSWAALYIWQLRPDALVLVTASALSPASGRAPGLPKSLARARLLLNLTANGSVQSRRSRLQK